MINISTNSRVKVFDVLYDGFYIFTFVNGVPGIVESTNLGHVTVDANSGFTMFLEAGDSLYVQTGNGLGLRGGRVGQDEL